jgi:FAD:protein FMN transferase
MNWLISMRSLFLSSVLSITALLGCFEAGAEIIFQRGNTMSTYYTVKIKDESYSYIFDQIARELKRLEDKFNDYDEDSELSYLNKYAKEGYFQVSNELYSLLEVCLNIAAQSKGCFDPSVRPLLKLWGFKDKRLYIPEEREIKELLKYLGWENIELLTDNRVRFKNDKIGIDLGGIAKGYAIDLVVTMLRSRGVKDALIDIGGDIYCLGSAADKGGWRVGIQDPGKASGVIARIELIDTAIVTSGGYERFLKGREKKAAHIIDPRDGLPVEADILSVTVLSPKAVYADGWATAFFVMGFDSAKEIVENDNDLEALFILDRDGELDIWLSTGLVDRVEFL